MPSDSTERGSKPLLDSKGRLKHTSSTEEPGTKIRANAANIKKKPPPESAKSIRLRIYVILSWWILIVTLGLPVWWITTSIYRAKLPLPAMMDWAEGRACRLEFPLQILVEAPPSLPRQDAHHLLRLTQHALDDSNDFPAQHLRLSLYKTKLESEDEALPTPPPPHARNIQNEEVPGSTPVPLSEASTDPEEMADIGPEHAALWIKLSPGASGSTLQAVLDQFTPTLEISFASNQLPSTSSTSSALANYIADTLQEIFTEEQAMIAHIFSQSMFPSGPASSTGQGVPSGTPVTPTAPKDTLKNSLKNISPELALDLSKRTTRSFKYSPTYHLTFSLFSPGATPSSWDIKEALEEYMIPLLEALSPLSNFTIDSQVQLYATFAPSVRGPEWDEDLKAWTLRNEDLSGFINAAEWPLSPGIGAAPTINFVVYVPSPAHTPLLVKEDGGSSSWVVPQWGGIKILNLPPDSSTKNSHLTLDHLKDPLTTHSHQLLSLLGTPRSPASLPLRLLTLTRVRAAALMLSASSTLGSLARLTLALPSISIPRSVANSVERTLRHLDSACVNLHNGRFHRVLHDGRIAEAEAERGFFEKSMVGQVYFPDEHKVAIYLPLLGPVAVPLIMGVIKEIKRVWHSRAQRESHT